MKALLVGINARYTHSNLALFYLRNEIEGCGHEAVIQEYHISQPRLDIIQDIYLEKPDVLLISAYIWNAQLVKSILPDLHSLLPEKPIILGGPEAGYDAGRWLEEFPFLECIVQGPGEASTRFLAQRAFRSDGPKIISMPNPPFEEIAFPYRESDLDRFSRRYVYYESSRGCPFSCSYCISSRADQGLDEKSADKTIEELSLIIAHEGRWPAPPIVKFVDRSFNADPVRARSIWTFLISVNTGATYHFEIHPGLLEEKDFTLLEGGPKGRFQFEIGIQTVNADTLEAVNRPMDWERVKPLIARLIRKGNIHIHLDMIAGLPGEGLAECGRSLDEILNLKPQQVQLGFLKSLPGTALNEEGSARGQIAMSRPPYQVLSNDALTVGDFRLLKRVEALVDSVWNANALETELDALARGSGGYFSALMKLSAFAERTGFDLSTRNAEKVTVFVRRCIAEERSDAG
jgi:radical SAM superfamily enzyme YgiQ (UPF0313 family)